MAKHAFKMLDAEMHVMEPVDLWERYIDPRVQGTRARRLNERRWDIRTLVEGEVMASMPGGDWPALSDAEEKTLATRYAEEIARELRSGIAALGDGQGGPGSRGPVPDRRRMYVIRLRHDGRRLRSGGVPRVQRLAARLHPGRRSAPDVRRRGGVASRRAERRRRDAPRGDRARDEGDLPATEHLQRPPLA